MNRKEKIATLCQQLVEGGIIQSIAWEHADHDIVEAVSCALYELDLDLTDAPLDDDQKERRLRKMLAEAMDEVQQLRKEVASYKNLVERMSCDISRATSTLGWMEDPKKLKVGYGS